MRCVLFDFVILSRRIVLIADDYHRYESGLNIEYRQWSKYNSTAKRLAMSYRHQSTNRFAFELLCLERWLILHEFCEQEQIERVIHLDTDVLTFEDFVVIEELLGDTENATSGRSPHVAFMTREAIRSMSDMIVEFYRG